MKKYVLLFFMSLMLLSACRTERYETSLPVLGAENIRIAPAFHLEYPGLPSPALDEDDREMVLLKLSGGKYSWFDATVENGASFDHKSQLYGKGNQLLADSADFPSLARKGLHSEKELRKTKIITGRSVSQITVDGRPWGSSGVGFMTDDETIMSVILADNRTVNSLGLTHPDMARPLFHLWNLAREFENYSIDTVTGERLQLETMIYNGNEVHVKISGSRGWQESIFNDEILGTGHIEITRQINEDEQEFLRQNYGNLPEDKYEELKRILFNIHTGEMVFFYINRYGFYEGHTEYRIDPAAVALIFGIRTIEEVHRACGGDLYKYFNTSFTENPE